MPGASVGATRTQGTACRVPVWGRSCTLPSLRASSDVTTAASSSIGLPKSRTCTTAICRVRGLVQEGPHDIHCRDFRQVRPNQDDVGCIGGCDAQRGHSVRRRFDRETALAEHVGHRLARPSVMVGDQHPDALLINHT